jgi:two-component system OmpR family response regulator
VQPDDRVLRWQEAWERRRRACLEDIARMRPSLTGEAAAILDDARRLAGSEDPAEHARADVGELVDRVNVLDGPAAVLLHRPVCNALTQLRIAAQEVLAARAGAAATPTRRPPAAWRRKPPGLKRFVVVSEDAEVRELVEECARGLGRPDPLTARTLVEAFAVFRALQDGSALVVVNLTLGSGADAGRHGLQVAAEARRRHHAVLLLTAAADYLNYWPLLPGVGLTGHDVIVKTRRDFADQLRSRIRALAQPAPVPVSHEEDTGHVVWIGDVEVADLEAQETLVLRALTSRWLTPVDIANECWDTDLQPSPGSVPSLISTLRRKLAAALVGADSLHAQREVIESRRREGQATQYRLAPWLEWVAPQQPEGAARTLPPVLVIEDDPDWSEWVVACLREHRWPVSAVRTADQARRVLTGGETPILVVDLGLPDPATGLPDHQVGLRLIEDVVRERRGVRVIVLSMHGSRDSLHPRLFAAGVRTVDVLPKTAERDEARTLLMASLQRAVDELRRGIRRQPESRVAHHVTRIERARIEVDGHAVARLSPREADVLDVLINRPNVPVMADLLEDRCYPRSGTKNKLHQTLKRLRQKIDRDVGRDGVGASVLRTPHRGARTTYMLHGVVIDQVEGSPDRLR